MRINAHLERARSFFDHRHSATALSIGAVIENLRVQAASEGYRVTITYGSNESVPSATLSFSVDHAVQIPRERVLSVYERTVNRRPFLPMRLSPRLLRNVIDDPVKGTSIRIIDQRQAISQWAKVIELADRIRYSHRVIHEELFSKLLFSPEQAREVGMGLEIDRLGLGPFGGTLLKWLRPWDRVQRMSQYGLIRILARQSRLLAQSCGALILVTVPTNTSESWLRAGEQVQRIWIRSHECGLQTHPMPVALYLDQRYQQEGGKNFFPVHRVLLDELRRKLAGLIQEGLGTMVFRIGHGWKMKGQSVRLPLDRLIERNVPSFGEPKEGTK